MISVQNFLDGVAIFYIIYLIGYASYLFLSILIGGINLYKKRRMGKIRNELKHQYYIPVSILVPAYNEEITIVDSVKSMLALAYQTFEIIVIDDGSKDNTAQVLIEAFDLKRIDRPIHLRIPCAPIKEVYELQIENVKLTLIRKENGGKGDALNVGINTSAYPYFICVDADSMLQSDSLEKIMQPVLEHNDVVAVAGMVRIAQCVEMQRGVVKNYVMPWNLILCMQVVEYDRSFLASRILMNEYNGNLIISGAFGLFKKDVVIAAGGYDYNTLGEDMELVVKLHMFCRNNKIKYRMCYEPNAICWSQAPSSLRDLGKQRRRWHLGLFQSMMKYRHMFANIRFGFVSFLSYMYYLFYELLSPMIEIFGLCTVILAMYTGFINMEFMIMFFLMYAIYGSVLTLTAFLQRIYTSHIHIRVLDLCKALVACIIETVFFRFYLSFVRIYAFVSYRQRKHQWGSIQREKQNIDKEIPSQEEA